MDAASRTVSFTHPILICNEHAEGLCSRSEPESVRRNRRPNRAQFRSVPDTFLCHPPGSRSDESMTAGPPSPGRKRISRRYRLRRPEMTDFYSGTLNRWFRDRLQRDRKGKLWCPSSEGLRGGFRKSFCALFSARRTDSRRVRDVPFLGRAGPQVPQTGSRPGAVPTLVRSDASSSGWRERTRKGVHVGSPRAVDGRVDNPSHRGSTPSR